MLHERLPRTSLCCGTTRTLTSRQSSPKWLTPPETSHNNRSAIELGVGLDSGTILKIVGAIYDAPLIGDWRPSLELIHSALNCKHVVLMTNDTRTGRHTPVGSRDPGIETSYIEQYMPLNDAWPSLAGQEVGKPVLDHNIMNVPQFEKNVFYNEFMRPNGMVTSSGLVLSRENGLVSAIVVNRSERSSEHERLDLEMLSLIRPHYQRAALLWKGRTALRDGELSLWEAADNLSIGILIVDHSGLVLRRNKMAADFLRNQSRHLIEQRPYAAPDALRSGLMLELLRSLRSDELNGVAGSYRLQAEEEAYLLTTLPLQGAPDWTGARRTCYAVVVSDLTRTPVSAQAALIAAYGLTKAEAKLAVRLGGGGDLSDIAARIGVQRSTVKTLLNRILLKTDTHSQSEIVRLVERFSLLRSRFG